MKLEWSVGAAVAKEATDAKGAAEAEGAADAEGAAAARGAVVVVYMVELILRLTSNWPPMSLILSL